MFKTPETELSQLKLGLSYAADYLLAASEIAKESVINGGVSKQIIE